MLLFSELCSLHEDTKIDLEDTAAAISTESLFWHRLRTQEPLMRCSSSVSEDYGGNSGSPVRIRPEIGLRASIAEPQSAKKGMSFQNEQRRILSNIALCNITFFCNCVHSDCAFCDCTLCNCAFCDCAFCNCVHSDCTLCNNRMLWLLKP